MKTIEELVGEVAKSLPTPKPVPKKQVTAEKPITVKTESKTAAEKTVNENKKPEINLSSAKKIADAVEIAAGIMGVNVVVTVCDKGANIVLLHAMDDSLIASIRASQDKAYTAVALKMPTHTALEESRGGSLDGLTNGNGILLLGGGYPLGDENKIYGGVGVSGGTKEQDTILAMVAAEYFKACFK